MNLFLKSSNFYCVHCQICRYLRSSEEPRGLGNGDSMVDESGQFVQSCLAIFQRQETLMVQILVHRGQGEASTTIPEGSIDGVKEFDESRQLAAKCFNPRVCISKRFSELVKSRANGAGGLYQRDR